MDSHAETDPRPPLTPEKTLILSPAIAQLEKILAEFDGITSEQHPELLRIKRESDEILQKKWAVLDKHSEYQRWMLERQLQCEIQCANEEIEDFGKPESD
jgi:hypothetical protein